ncbi:MAG: aspartyl/asparaginyl beta-hydroxylase domain-containing protein [Myxococcota bacterium]
MTTFLIVVGALLLLVGGAVWKLRSLDSSRKKRFIKWTVRAFYQRLEDWGVIEPTPAYIRDYHRQYPGLEALEKNHAVIREECLALLERKNDLTDISALGGNYTQQGIHVIQWKSFMFKSGDFIAENCRLAPRTADLIRQVPGCYTAFFSILDPKQYVTPHWGYYKGFLRYHLGVIIPYENKDEQCWLRVNDDPVANANKDESAIVQGEKYCWHEGEGVVFDDTHLHDACNDSDQVRVVLWLDLRKRLPWYVQWVNVLFLWIAHKDKSVQKIRENARVAA